MNARVMVAIESALYRKLRAAARKDDRSIASLVRKIIHDWLAR